MTLFNVRNLSTRVVAVATLLLAALLIGRWYVDTRWTTETLQAVEAGHITSRAGAAAQHKGAERVVR